MKKRLSVILSFVLLVSVLSSCGEASLLRDSSRPMEDHSVTRSVQISTADFSSEIIPLTDIVSSSDDSAFFAASEEASRAEESRRVVEESRAEESRRAAEESLAEESRRAAEESRAEESRKAAEEASRKAAEASKKAAEDASRKAAEEASRKAAEASKKAAQSQNSDVRDYIANKNTKKFHYTWCKEINKMKESNKWYFHGTRNQLINYGYQPCKKCNP